MGQPMEVVVSELNSAATRLADAQQRLQDGLSAVDLSVDQLLGAGWQGGAASAYRTEWDAWHNGAGQVVRALGSMAEALRSAGSRYEATDQQSAQALDSALQPPSGSPGGGGSPGAPAATAQQPTGTGAGSAPAGQAGGADGMAALMGLGQPAAQTATGIAQAAGQLAAGLAQAAAGLAQGVTGVVQAAQGQAGAADPEKAAEDDERDREPGDPDEAGADAAPTGGLAPVEAPRASESDAVTGVSRPSGAQ